MPKWKCTGLLIDLLTQTLGHLLQNYCWFSLSALAHALKRSVELQILLVPLLRDSQPRDVSACKNPLLCPFT